MPAEGGGATPPLEIVDIPMTDGAVVRLRRHGVVHGPRLALSHGNGFAVAGYEAFWRLLADRFDLVLFDLRNHGANPRHRQDAHRLSNIVADFADIRAGIDAAFGAKPVFGLFHSISAIGAILAAEKGVTWDGLVLVDPPLSVPEDHPLRPAQARLDGMLAAWSATRPATFESLDAYGTELESSRIYARCVPGAARAMAAATTRALPDGGRELACPGPWESAIYRDNLDAGSFLALDRMTMPVMILGADPAAPDAKPPALVSQAAAKAFDIPYASVAETTHFLQIERPENVVNAALTFLRSHGATG